MLVDVIFQAYNVEVLGIVKYTAKNLELCVLTLFTVHAANGIIVVAQLGRALGFETL